MVTEVQNGAATRSSDWQPSSPQTSIAGLGDQKMVVLSPQQLKQIKEVAGLSANFDSDGVKEAFVEVPTVDQVTAVIEIFKNAKPAEIGLRYARETWTADDSGSSRLTVRTTYGAIADMANLRAVVSEIAQIGDSDQQPVRINLKDSTLIVSNVASVGAGLTLEQRETGSKDTSNTAEVESNRMSLETATATKQQTNNRSFSSSEPAETAKYATYSRSEVDRMFKQQTEAIASSLGGKLSSQSKAFQEAIDEQQKTFNKSIEKVIEQIDDFRIKLEANAANQKTATKEQFDRFSNDLSKELEQFRATLNKSIVPSIKTMDEKLRQVCETAPTPSQANNQSGSSGTNTGILTALVCASLIASIISIVLQVVHH